jgi:hypothetical protein
MWAATISSAPRRADAGPANGARPTVILAHTLKGWGTALAADPLITPR